MYASIISLCLLLMTLSFAAQAAPPGPGSDDFSAPALASGMFDPVFAEPDSGSAPGLSGPQIHYAAQASGLDRIDPASFTVLGGEIGGSGVQGGGVVSLTWATQP
jgi:hypothetical protein